MKKRPLIASLSAIALAISMFATGCAGGNGPRATDSIRIILGHGAAPGNPRSNAALEFKKLVEEKSNHEVEIQILGQESVGSDTEMMVSVAAGTLDMTINSQGPFASYVPEASLIGLPFLFENSQHAYKVIDSEEVEGYLAKQADKKGFHVLGFWDNGMRDLTNSKWEINSPADVKGLKIRTPDDVMTISIFNQLGANPTPMAFGELYLALKTGAVDGQENPVVNIKSSALDEVQPNLAVTGHKYEVNPFVISKARWERLDPKIQGIIEESAREAQESQREEMGEQTQEIYKEFAGKLTVTHPDRGAFREVTAPVYEEWEKKYPEFYKTITQMADDTRSQFTDEGGQ